MNCIRDLAKLFVALTWMVSAPVSAWASSGYIFDSSGSVTIAIGKDAPRPALEKDTVTSGMTIRTGDESHAVLKFEDGEVISMQANSALLVRDYNYDARQVDHSKLVFSMLKGGMRFVSGSIGQQNPKAFRLATPQATIAILGTDFFAVLTDKGLYNQVSSGRISLTNSAGRSVFTSGNSSLTASATSRPVSIPPVDVPAETFSQVAAIPVPPAVPGAIPMPVPAPVPVPIYVPVPVPGVTAALAVPLAAAVPVEDVLMPAPVADVTPALALPLAVVPVEDGLTTVVAAESTPGGAATGGAVAATTIATAETGISGTEIAIGLGFAVGVAALVNTSSTSHH